MNEVRKSSYELAVSDRLSVLKPEHRRELDTDLPPRGEIVPHMQIGAAFLAATPSAP